MDEQQRRITEDLSGLLKGEIRCDPLTVTMYATDGSLYQIPPVAVAFPKDREDVVVLARYSAEIGVPLIARGAGTGVAGGAIGSGIVVDFSKHMRRVEQISDDTVRVQPGIVRDRLNHVLRESGKYFPPDPSNTAVTTVGGMLGVDAAGSHSVRVGSTRDHVKSIELVLPGGTVVEAGNESLDAIRTPTNGKDNALSRTGDGLHEKADGSFSSKRTIVSKLFKMLADNEQLIQEKQPPLIRNCCGYNLRGVLSENRLNLPRLLVGSEGTLGLFTAATLHVSPRPAHRGVVLLLFGEMEAAVRTVQEIAKQQPSACDLLDRRLLSLAREADPRFEKLISPAAEAALIVEQVGFSDAQVRSRIQMVIRTVRSLNASTVVAAEAFTWEDVEFLWSLPTKVVPLLIRLKGPTRPLPFVEDIAVPPESLNDFLIRAQKVFQNHQVTASLYAHAAAGQIHLRPFLPVPGPEDGQQIEAIARDLYQGVFAVGGTISGEHGDGLARTAFIRSQYGALYRVFQQVKDVFDPHNLMNPGKIISDDPHVTVRNMRTQPVAESGLFELQLQWSPADIAEAATLCNGCGTCRTQSDESRMCPFFRVDQSEEASPRSKANILRNVLGQELDPQNLSSPDMKRLAELCFNCKQCQIECPSNVNIPHMMIEAKSAYVAANGLSRADWILSRAHSFGMIGSAASIATNWAISNPSARWVLEKLLGIARRRKLPRFARRPFLRNFGQNFRKLPQQADSPKPVVYFVGDYANYYDPELAKAFVEILRHNSIPVYIPSGQTASGMAMLSAGDLDAARDIAEQNVRELAELAREGYAIVCTEPSAVVCLKEEYPMLLDNPDVDLVASRVIEAGMFLESLHQKGVFRTDFSPLDLDIGYHTPCHLKFLAGGSPLKRLLSLIPQLRVHTIEEGCSGMAGAFGLTRDNFRTSIRIGWGLISRMRVGDLDAGTTECSSCKIQMEQGTTVPTIHPLKLMALSYGLMPEIQEKLKPAPKHLVVT